MDGCTQHRAGSCFHRPCQTRLHPKTMENAGSCPRQLSAELILSLLLLLPDKRPGRNEIPNSYTVLAAQAPQESLSGSFLHPSIRPQSCDHLCSSRERNRMGFCSAANPKEVYFVLSKVRAQQEMGLFISEKKKPTPTCHLCFMDQ